jgi:SPP1 gp7 family putative phage head morphogenesis protein
MMRLFNHHLADARNKLLKPKHVGKLPIWQTPDLIGLKYAAELIEKVVKQWEHIVTATIIPAIPAIVEQLAVKYDSDLDVVISKTKGFFIQVINQQVPQSALKFAKETEAHNRKQAEKVFSTVVGHDIQIPLFSQNEEAIVRQFIKENVSYITGIAEETARKLEQRIFSGIKKGYNAEQLQKSIQYRFGIDKSIFKTIKARMQLIAEDQIGKLNGKLTEMRQVAMGVEKYTWRTMGDDRVRGNPQGLYPKSRPSHWIREGKKYKWSKPPVDGHPGIPIRCRCYAEPVIKGVLNA